MSKDAANAAMKPICTFEDCDKPHKARGLCAKLHTHDDHEQWSQKQEKKL